MSKIYTIKDTVKAPGFIGDGSQLTIEAEEGNLKEVLSSKLNKTADYIQEMKDVKIGKKYVFPHNFGILPCLIQVWVKSDGTQDSKGVHEDAKEWKMAGVLCLWEGGLSYGVIVEKIDSKEILVRTGNSGLFHGDRAHNFFKSGEVRVMAWK